MGSQSSSMRSSDAYDQSQNVSSQYGNANNVHTSGNVTITDASPEIVGKAFDFGSFALKNATDFGNNALQSNNTVVKDALAFGNNAQNNMLTFTERVTDSLQNAQNASLKAIENLKTDGANTVQKVAIITGVGIAGITLVAIFLKRK